MSKSFIHVQSSL